MISDMHLFLYGTLLDLDTLAARSGDPSLPARMRPALLRGWRRVQVKNSRFPTLTRDRQGEVRGAVVSVSAAALRRLQAYEGEGYELVRVLAQTRTGPLTAFAWIAGSATRHPWRA
jgi:gamma-glutamylcyclotransferase (GGCT)/AIG2-like uncharacterized protein YtfP